MHILTTTGIESHFGYVATLPRKLGEFQHKLGFEKQGSYIIGSKNPKYPGQAYAQVPAGPEYPCKVRTAV